MFAFSFHESNSGQWGAMRPKRCFGFVISIFALFAFFYSITLILRLYSTNTKVSESARKFSEKRSNLIEKSVFARYGNTDELRLFSAFSNPDRITVIIQSYGYFARKVYCRYLDHVYEEVCPSYATIVFPEYTVHCEPCTTAKQITITINKDDKINSTSVVELLHRTNNEFTFSVCLAPLFGSDSKWLLLLEFLEYYKLQGAEHFYVYTLDVDPASRHIVESFENENSLEIIQIDNSTKCMGRHRCRHEMQLQDCISRARQHSQWVATVDLDERIYPLKHDTLFDMVSSIKDDSIAELRFRCRWVLRYEEIPKNPSLESLSELPILKWHNTSHVAPLNHTTKSIVNPLKVESMGVHQSMRILPHSSVQLVSPEIAVVRHYRLQRGWSFFLKETETFGEFDDTSIDTGSEKKLKEATRKRFQTVFG